MIIDDILDNGGYDVSNPNYNPKTKKGRAEQPYLKSSNIADGHPMVNAGYDVNKHEAFMFNVADYDKYINGGISLNTWEDPKIWDKELADKQSGLTKLAHGVEQAIVSELALGIPKGISDLFDAIGQAVSISDGDYTNPVSQYLEKLQEDFKNYTPIYSDPDRNTIADGGLGNMGWWAENIPSVMSSLTLLVPSAGITKGVSMLGKLSKVQRATQKAVKFLTGSSSPATMKKAGLMFENGMTAALSRTMENYQEAQGVYQDMKNQIMAMSDEDYTKVVANMNLPENIDASDKEAVADYVAHKSATETFIDDYANIGFDVIQLYALRNAWKGLRSARGSAKLNDASKRAIETAGMSAEEVAAYDAAHSGVKNAGNWIKNQLVGGYKTIAAEASEGVEEAVNYISQQEGMHLGNLMLGNEQPSAFDTRLKEYMSAPQLWDSAFWGVMGGIAFQGLGSTFNRIQNKIVEGNKKADKKTGEDVEAVKKTAWWQLDELPEIKRRKANIENQNIRLNQFMENINTVMGDENTPGIAIYSEDKHKFDDTEQSKIEQEITRQRVINEFVDDLVTEAANNGNIDYLKAYMSSDEVRKAMVNAGVISENDSKTFMQNINNRIDHIGELFDEDITQLNDIAGKEDLNVPVEYLQIIANNNVQHKLNIEEYDRIKNRYDEEVAKISLGLKKNQKATDEQLEFYKNLVDIQVKNQELASLKAKKREIEDDKNQATTISGQVAIDDLNTRINAIEKQIYDDTNDITLGTSLFVADVANRAVIGKEGRLGIKTDRKAIKRLDDLLAGKFDDFLKSIGSSKSSEDFNADVVRQRFSQLKDDIKRITSKNSELDNLNPELKSLYARLSSTDVAITYEQSKLTSTVDEVKHYANQLNNTMVTSRKEAIQKAYDGIVELNKKYKDISLADVINNSPNIEAFNKSTETMSEEDKTKLNEYLQVLNLTSDSNKNLGLNIANAIRKAEILDALQQATEDEENGVTPGSTNGESSSTVQQPISSVQPASMINQSPDQQNQPQSQGNTLNPAQQGQGQQGQGQNQNREDNVVSTITALNTNDTALRDRILNNSNPEDRDTAIAELSTVYALTPEETNSILNGIGYQPTIPSTGVEDSNSETNTPTKLSDVEVSTFLNKETTNWFRSKIQNKEEITFDEYNTAMQEVFNRAEDEAAARREAVEQYKDFAEIVSSNDEISGLVKDVINSESTLDETKPDKFTQEYDKANKALITRFRQDLGLKKIGGKYHISVEDLLRYCNAHANSTAPGHLIYNQLVNYLKSDKLSDYVVDDIKQATSAGFIGRVDESLIDRINSKKDNQRIGVEYYLNEIADKKDLLDTTLKEIDSIQVGDELTYTVNENIINIKHNGITIGVLAVPKNGKGKLNGWTYDIAHSKGGLISEFKNALIDIINSDEQEAKDIIEVLRDLGNYGLTKADKKELIDRLSTNNIWNKLVDNFAVENESNDVLAEHLAKVFVYDRNFRSAFEDVNRNNAIATLNQWFDVISRSFDEATYLSVNPGTAIKVTEATQEQNRISNDRNEIAKKARPINEKGVIADRYKGSIRIGMAPMKNIGEIIASKSDKVSSTLDAGGIPSGSTFVIIPNINGEPAYVQAYPAKIGETYTSLEFNNIISEINKVIKDSITNAINKSGDRTQAVAALQPARNLLIQLLNNWKGNTPLFVGLRIGYEPAKSYVINIFDKGGKNPMDIGIDVHGDFYYRNKGTNYNRSQVTVDKIVDDIFNKIKESTVLNIGEDWVKSDNNTSMILGGVAFRTSDGKFQIKIGNNTPHVFDSFNDFVIKNNLVRVNTLVGDNNDNFHRVDENGLITNSSIKYGRTEIVATPPVEEIVDKEIKSKYDEVSSLLNLDGNNLFDSTSGEELATVILKGHSSYKKLIKGLMENDLLPKEVRFDSNVQGNAKVNRNTGEVVVGKHWLDKIALGKDGQKQAIRKLVHERLHYLIEKNGDTDNIRKSIREIYNAFVASNPTGLNQYITWNGNVRYWDEANQTLTDEGIEEFFVESLTASDLAKYLNSVQSTKDAKASDVKNETLWQKIMRILQNLLGVKIKDNTLYAQEFMLFTEAISPDTTENIVQEDIEDTTVQQEENNEFKYDTNNKLDINKDISDEYDDDYSLLDETTGSIESLTETLPLDTQEKFVSLVNDGVISMICH